MICSSPYQCKDFDKEETPIPISEFCSHPNVLYNRTSLFQSIVDVKCRYLILKKYYPVWYQTERTVSTSSPEKVDQKVFSSKDQASCLPASLSHWFPILVANSNVANHSLASPIKNGINITTKKTKVSSSCEI